MIYVIGDYEEHGTVNTFACLSRDDIPAMVDAYVKAIGGDAPPEVIKIRDTFVAEMRASLDKLMQKTDAELVAAEDQPHALHHGWGGALLYVIEPVKAAP